VAAAAESPVWRTVVVDSLGLMLVVWSIPLAIIVVGAPIVMLASLIITALQRLL
jgi:hypothetical protein